MRAKTRVAWVVAIAVTVVVCLLPLHSVFAASATPAWVGSYWGQVQGTGSSGTGDTPCSIWVESVDTKTARISIHVPGLPLLAALGTVKPSGTDSVDIALQYGTSGVDVGAAITLRQDGPSGAWQITGDGSGRAFGLNGTGKVAALQYYKWIAMPSFADQVSGTIDALLGKPSPPAGFPEKGANEPPPPSPVLPFETRPPLSLGDMLAIDMGLGLLLMLMMAL